MSGGTDGWAEGENQPNRQGKKAPIRVSLHHPVIITPCLSLYFYLSSLFTAVEADATAFSDLTVQKIAEDLHRFGYQKHGNEVMYNGHTGMVFLNVFVSDFGDESKEEEFAERGFSSLQLILST